MKSNTLSIRDTIWAVLRDASGPMSTSQISKAAGGYLEFRPDVCHPIWHDANGMSVENRRERGWAYIVSCDGSNHLMYMPFSIGSRAYAELKRLEAAGKVNCIRVPDQRSVYWMLSKPVVPDLDIVALEYAWELSQ